MKPDTVIVVGCTQSDVALKLMEHDISIQAIENINNMPQPEPIPFKMVPRIEYTEQYFPQKGSKYHR